MAEETLRKKINGKNLYARMAEYDSEGNFIASTYSRKDEPVLDIVQGSGISITDSTNTVTISLTPTMVALLEFLGTKPSSGHYTIDSVNGELTWVNIEMTDV